MKRLMMMSLVALALVAAACGDDDEATETTAGAGTTQIAATATSFSYTPDLWTVGTGDEVTLTLTNSSDVEHEWVIMRAPIASEAEFTEEGVLTEVEAAPGAVNTLTFTAPAAGTYQIICGLEGHFDGGMKGELVVTG